MIYIESKTFFSVENREGCSKFFVSRNNNDFTKMKYAHTQLRESDSYTFPLTNHGQKWVFTIQLRSPTQNLLCKKCNFVTGESSTRDEINYEGCAGPCRGYFEHREKCFHVAITIHQIKRETNQSVLGIGQGARNRNHPFSWLLALTRESASA